MTLWFDPELENLMIYSPKSKQAILYYFDGFAYEGILLYKPMKGSKTGWVYIGEFD